MAKPYPWYYAVNDRPVKIVQMPDGGTDCLVFDFVTGGFLPDRSYFSRVLPGPGKDVDQLTEAEFEQLVAAQRRSGLKRLIDTPINWQMDLHSGPGYQAVHNGRTYTMRLNPPERTAYTLLVDRQEIADLQLWPPAWQRPGAVDKQAAPHEESGPSIDPALLRRWSEQLCRLASPDPNEMAAALGLQGAVVDKGSTCAIEPPPPGTTRLTLHRHPVGFDYVEVVLAGNSLTRAQLDAHFGEGRDMPRMGPYSPYMLAYRVEVPGAPFTCAVFAHFQEPPTLATAASEMMLRRDRASA